MAKESLESAAEHAASSDLAPAVKTSRTVSTFPEPANVPSFGAFESDDEDEGSKSKKPYFIVAAIVIAAGMAFYGWNLKHGSSAAPAPSSAPVSTAPVQAQPEPVAPAPAAPVQNSQPVVSQPTSSAHDQPAHAAKTPESTKNSLVAEDTVTKIAPLVVKAGAPKLTDRAAAANEPAPQAPALNISGASSDDAALNSVVASTPVNVPKHVQQTLRISQGVSQGLLLKRVQPVYPPQAMQMRIQGAVQLMATISKEGNISSLSVQSGDGILARSASDAVRQWKYKPYYLNGEPVEIQTQITVNFKLPN
jgi:protein TonB